MLEKGSLFESRGVVTKRNKGRGRVVLRVAGVEIKMERHLLGKPFRTGLLQGFGANMGGKAGTSANSPLKTEAEMSAKEKRLLKMLNEDLVDPDKMLSFNKKANGSGGGKSSEQRTITSGIRLSSNTLDISKLTELTDIQSAITTYIERYVDNESLNDRYGLIYIFHGNSKLADSLKIKIRSWVRKHTLIKSVRSANASDGGDAYSALEIDLSDD